LGLLTDTKSEALPRSSMAVRKTLQNIGMKKLLIIKNGAPGDVLRTTTLLYLFRDWEIDWLTEKASRDLLVNDYIHCLIDDVDLIDSGKPYDLVINLEDSGDFVAAALSRIKSTKIFGSYVDHEKKICYTPESAEWFDMGLISKHGIQKANEKKMKNRSSYQEIIFRALGYQFEGQRYILPKHIPFSQLRGDIAIAPKAGQRWPVKNWYYFDDLAVALSKKYKVNYLPMRKTILEHIGDIKGHKFLISTDSLPMHLALGLGIACVAIFTCTSPWEIYDYNLLTKVVSPKLEQYFYSLEFSEDAVKCIPYQQVYDVTIEQLRFHQV
jgi:ADP-heptose:LPS heptosyltransferase